MKYAKFNLSVNEKDIRKVCANILSAILSRHQDKCNEHVSDLNEAMQNGTQIQIVESLSSWLSVHDQAAKEIQRLGELLDILDLGRSDTEVLEDLTDLKEDSLRIDSGSE
jgi:hypothetical protein